MFELLVEIVLGLICGMFLGVTGIIPSSIILFVLQLLGIGSYQTNLGSILFINLFPITIGSVYEFYKAKKIDYKMGFILLFTAMLGSYIGSKFVLGFNGFKLTEKQIKLITSLLGFIIFVTFLYSALTTKK